MLDCYFILFQFYFEWVKMVIYLFFWYFFWLMDFKVFNFCFSVDVIMVWEFFVFVDRVGLFIVVFKIYYDLILGWDYNLQIGIGVKFVVFVRKYGFFIFEDRKFVDIGKIVQMQYIVGIVCIIEWVYIINVNIDVGKDMVCVMVEVVVNWKVCIYYEVKMFVFVGILVVGQFDDGEE